MDRVDTFRSIGNSGPGFDDLLGCARAVVTLLPKYFMIELVSLSFTGFICFLGVFFSSNFSAVLPFGRPLFLFGITSKILPSVDISGGCG